MARKRVASTVFGLALVTIASPALAEDTCSLESVTRLRGERRLLVAKAMAHECATSAACSAEARGACTAAENDLARSIPTITVVLDGDASRTTLSLDGAALTPGVGYSVDPGPHVVTLATVDGERREENVVVAENDRARLVMLAPARRAEPRAPNVPTTASPSTGPYFVVGGGLLLLLGAATMQTFARVEESDSQSLYRDSSQRESGRLKDLYNESARSHHDAAMTNQAIAITLATAGVISLAVGATWWLTSRSARSEPKTGLLARPLRVTF